MKKLLHHHIHKTGGTTFNSLLNSVYGDSAVTQQDIFNYIGAGRPGFPQSEPQYSELINTFSCIHEHFTLLDIIPNDWIKVIFLRDPVDRVASMYYDWCSLIESDLKDSDYSAQYKRNAINMPLHELIQYKVPTDPLLKPHQQAYVKMTEFFHNGMCKSLIRHKFKEMILLDMTDEDLFSEAKKVLCEFEYVGSTESMNQDITAIFNLINQPAPEVPKLNTRESKFSRIRSLNREIHPIKRDAVGRYNIADRKLYDYEIN